MLKVPERFGALRAIAGLVMLVAVLALVVPLVTAFTDSGLAGQTRVATVAVGLVAFLLLAAVSQSISVIVAIEHNTRVTAEALSRQIEPKADEPEKKNPQSRFDRAMDDRVAMAMRGTE